MLGVVLIDFNSQERTTQYILDLLESSDIMPDSIVVVDNSPNLNNFFSLKKAMFKIGFQENNDIQVQEKIVDKQSIGYINKTKMYFLHSKENLGFAKANNLGFRVIRAFDKVQYVLFSNSDILFENKKVELSCLIKDLKENANGFIIGPKVIYPDGRLQSPCRYISIYKRWWRNSLMWPFTKPLSPEKRELITNAEKGNVYRIVGAFMLADSQKFEKIGGFDEKTFLYAEELILAERGKKYGYNVLYTPQVEIIHENGYTVRKERTPKSRDFKLKEMLKSDLYYYEYYMGVNKVVINLTRAVVKIYFFKLHIKDIVKHWIGEKH